MNEATWEIRQSGADGIDVVSDESGSEFPVVRLGAGHVIVADGRFDGAPALIFLHGGSGVVGEEMPGNRVASPGEAACIVTISTRNAVDVVRSALDRIAAGMDEEQNG